MKKLLFSFLVAGIALSFAACKEKAPETVELNWGTFNIRYDNPDDSMNNWQYRKDSAAAFVLQQDLDVFGCQEVLANQMQDLLDRLPDYQCVGVCRDDGDKEGEASPIFFKKDRFEVLRSSTFWLSQYPDSVGFVGWDGACCRIATWAKLKEKKSGRIFMAVNTHFDHIGVEARRNAALLIIDSIKSIVGDQPAIVTGDFNVNDQSEAYKTITGNEFVLKDAYKIAEKVEGVNYTFHDFGLEPMEKREKIDFIFVTPQISVQRAYIPEPAKGPTGFLSDHNPHAVHITF